MCVQSPRYKDLFLQIGVAAKKIVVTGNLKLDTPHPVIDKAAWAERLSICPGDRVITLGSTHDPEEELLLDALASLPVKILIVPRHPARFEAVADLLRRKGIDHVRYSEGKLDPSQRVVLVDAMGILNTCYQLSELAIVGGSFTPGVGGHNIFEPASLGIPILFGPYMESQKDLTRLILEAPAGAQVSIEQLRPLVIQFLERPPPVTSKMENGSPPRPKGRRNGHYNRL